MKNSNASLRLNKFSTEISPDGQELVIRVPLLNARKLVMEAFGVELASIVDVRLLSERESEALREVRLGKGNKAIAETMHISERTVKFHVSNLLDKFGFKQREQLIRAKTNPRATGRKRKRASDLNGRDATVQFIPTGPGECVIKRNDDPCTDDQGSQRVQ